MCTVVFIPNGRRVYFGSLRDESPKRLRAKKPEKNNLNEVSFLSPTDPVAGGTWVGVSNTNHVIILLNGGFENHNRKNYYRKSRGLIVCELLASKTPIIEWELLNMEDIEPFTLIVWSNNNLFQLVWDGQNRNNICLDETVPYIWSSSTLYSSAAKANREKLFRNWISTKPMVSKISLLDFFNTNTDFENGFIINREEITKTLSFTFIALTKNYGALLSYYDFLNRSNNINEIEMQSEFFNTEISDDLSINSIQNN